MKNSYYVTTFIITSALLISSLAFSQKVANNWLFGDFGLEFKSDTVVIRKDYAVHKNRGMGIISDSNGQLLCYTDGMTIWNKNHTIMPNGQNMSTTLSGTKIQSSLIIPKPGSSSIYYTFTVHTYNGQSAAGLYYSIVDITKDNGLGDVTLKGNKIQDQTDNKITAVYHQNGYDVWIITHQHNSNSYYAYLLTDKGLDETPVVSSLGKSFSSSFAGQLKASPDGTMIACSYDVSYNAEGFSLFKFDNSTGSLSSSLSFSMPVTYRGCDGMEFSPDAKKLYVYQSGSTGESALYQYDISTVTYDYINNSRTKLFNNMDNGLLELQLAPDGKIYFTKGGGQDSGTRYLGVVQNPNDLGTSCIVKELGLYLDGASAQAWTPTFIQNYFFKTSFTFSNACSGNLTDFQITNETGLDSVSWDFGQGSKSVSRHPQCSYALPGKYTVTLFAHYPAKTDTIRKQITINPSPVFDLGKDTTVCYGHELSVPEGFKSYRWNTGANTRSIIITTPGSYQLTVENDFGCQTTDSVYLDVAALPVIDLPDSIQMGTLDSIPVSAGNFKSYFWNTGETTSTIYIKKEGWYSVTVQNETGCSATKSFYAYINKPSAGDPNEWKLLNPQPTALTGLDICFLNSQIGYILNESQILGTSDAGKTWKVLMKVNSARLMAFKNNYGYIIGNYGAIYKSTYMGAGWNRLNTPFTDNLNGISVISKDTVFVTGTNKLYSTFDGGQHWITSNITNQVITSSYFSSSTTGHVGCSNGNVYKTEDSGKTWILKSSTNSSSSNINKIYFVNPDTGFISRGYGGEILKTTDAGETWKLNTDTTDDINCFFFLDSQNGFIAGEYGVIFKTTNGGATWNSIGFQNGRYEGTDINSIFFIDSMTGFAVGLGGRIMKTTDGGKTWNGYAPTYNSIKQLEFMSDTTMYGLVGNSFIKSTDGGNTWTNMGAPVSTGSTNQFDFVDENTGYCIAGGASGTYSNVSKVFKTTDGGKTWTATNGGKDIMYDDLYTIDFIDDKTGFVNGGYNDTKTFKTTDGGNTWTKINDYSFREITFLSPLVGYARSYNKIYKTIDGGNTWIASIISELSGGISSFDFTDENNGYCTGSSGAEVFKTTNGGTSWQKLTVPYNYYINIKFFSPNVGYITEDYGRTYQTSNGGISWTQLTKPYSVTGIELYADEIYAFGGSGIIMKKKVEFKPAVLVVNQASLVTNNSATLSGNVTSNNQLIKNIQFEYGPGPLITKVEVLPDSVQPNANLNLSINLKDLKPNQIYSFRLTATANGIHYSSDMLQFTTLPDYAISMSYVYNVGSNDADLTGNVVSNSGDITNIEFQYGTDTTFTFKVAAQPAQISSGMSKIILAHISSLQPLTRYYARIKANYKGTTIYSPITVFTTTNTYAIDIYNPFITGNNANFNIYIRANQDTIRNVAMEYGTTREYKNKIDISGQITKGTSKYLTTQLTGLDSATVYYYRIRANMGDEVIYSTENILKLKRDIVMIPIEFKQLSESSVLLQGLINGNGSYLRNIKFHYGPTENLGDSVLATPYYAYNNITNLVSSPLYHLTPKLKYYARISTTNGTAMFYSDIFTFIISDTGLDSLEDDPEILIYPNPATNYLMINSLKTVNKVEISDLMGKTSITSNNETKINISQLQKGVYLIHIYLADKVITKKMIKN